jgi:polysaccharide export outer membrane protein
MIEEKQKKNKRIWFLFIGFLISVICSSIFALAQEVTPSTDEAEVQMEKEIIQGAERQKEAQLKEYFRDYYYKQGIVYYKNGHFQEAMAKFKRALYWWPEYKPAIRYIGLIEDKIAQSQKASMPQEIPPEVKIEEAKAKKEVVIIEETKTKKIEEEKKTPSSELKKEEIPSAQIGEYRIDISDVLDISVWKVPDLSQSEVIVRPDGKISLPLIGDIKAAGLTLSELDKEITQKYALYVREPQVSVMIRKFGGKKVIVLGEVARPGVYTFTGDIQVVEALALAGDCTKYAVKNNVLIIRGDIHKNPTIISSNVLAFLKNARLNENVLIQSQDVIFVPRSLIGNINAFVETIAPIVDMVYKGSTTKTAIESF